MKIRWKGEWRCLYCGQPWSDPVCQDHLDELNRQAEQEGLGLGSTSSADTNHHVGGEG